MAYTSKNTAANIDSLLGQVSSKIADAPADGKQYVRNNGAWTALNQSLLATVVGPRQMIAQNGSGEQAYTFSFDQPAASITLKSLSISGPGVSLKAGYSKSGFTVVATDIVGDITAIITAVFTFGSIDYTIDAPIIVSYQYYLDTNGYDYVDLGLPSGTLWATCNVGATSPEERGKYFMWGETEGNTVTVTSGAGTPGGGREYDFGTFNSLGLDSLSGNLDLSHDAASVHMGSVWHMPTKEQCEELINHTTNDSRRTDSLNGVNGVKFQSKTDPSKVLFFPFCGYCTQSTCTYMDQFGDYWTSSMYNVTQGHYLRLLTGSFTSFAVDYDYKYLGFPIRAVI